MSQTFIREAKRDAMKAAGLTFTERVRRSLGTGKPVKDVKFKVEGPVKNRYLVAEEVA